MDTPAKRLKWARQKAGYETATAAALAYAWKVPTYLGHENGDRIPSRKAAIRYGAAFKVSWAWLLEGGPSPKVSPVVGAATPASVLSTREGRKIGGVSLRIEPMLKVGETYLVTFWTGPNEPTRTDRAKVVDVQMPLVRLRNESNEDEIVVNVNSAAFVGAKKVA